MNRHSGPDSLDLFAIAHQAMVDAGFVPDFPQMVSQELRTIESSGQPAPPDKEERDLRGLLWSSIDNRESRDLDQVEYAEGLPNGDVRVRVGIADVDAIVHIHS